MSRRRSGRRTRVALCIVAIIAVLAMLTPASAAPSFVIAAPGNAGLPVYYTPFVVLQRGQALNFINLDVAPHDVRSTVGLFFSNVISIGKKTPVFGAQNLGRGSYKFYCSIHPIMKGTLRVV